MPLAEAVTYACRQVSMRLSGTQLCDVSFDRQRDEERRRAGHRRDVVNRRNHLARLRIFKRGSAQPHAETPPARGRAFASPGDDRIRVGGRRGTPGPEIKDVLAMPDVEAGLLAIRVTQQQAGDGCAGRVPEAGVSVQDVYPPAGAMHGDTFHSFRQDIAAFDPALALQLDEALHVETDAAQFLPARGQAGEVVAGILVRQPARLQRTVGVLRQAYGDELRPMTAY